mmetsp:Transcript_23555/g.58197  ORF Transcript_23555/g.58197 Transcript_23555/m.58197 type:complete len:220 (+) Transcript_23555:1389-2048(+)
MDRMTHATAMALFREDTLPRQCLLCSTRDQRVHACICARQSVVGSSSNAQRQASPVCVCNTPTRPFNSPRQRAKAPPSSPIHTRQIPATPHTQGRQAGTYVCLSVCLLDGDLCSRILELLLSILGLVFWHSLEEGLGQPVDELLGLLEIQLGVQLPQHLNHANPVLDSLKDDVKLGLLGHLLRLCRPTSGTRHHHGAHRHRRRRRCVHSKGLLDLLDQF